MMPSASTSSSAIRQVALGGSDDTGEHNQSRQTVDDDDENHIEYRRARDIPFELREHCTICFEEGLCKYALFRSTSDYYVFGRCFLV